MKILIIGLECGGYAKQRFEMQKEAYAYCSAFGAETPGYAEERARWADMGIPVFDTLDTAINVFQPELAVIGVPNTVKNDLSIERRLIEYKIPVMEYKFRIRDYNAFRSFAEEIRKQNVPLYVGEPYLYRDCVRYLRRKLPEWNLGRVEHVRWRCARDGEGAPWMRTYRHLALEDLGLHHLSVLHGLLNLTGADVQARSLSPKKGGDMRGTICEEWMKLASGTTVSHSIDWNGAMDETDWLGTICIECEHGGVTVKDNRIWLERWGEKPQEIQWELKPLNPLEDVIALLNEGKAENIQLLAEFMPVIETIDKAIRSAEAEK